MVSIFGYRSSLRRRVRGRRLRRRMKSIAKVFLPVAVVAVMIWLAMFFGGRLNRREDARIREPSDQEMIDSPVSRQVHEAVLAGDYGKALQLLDRGPKTDSDKQVLKTLRSQLMDELKVRLRFHYLPGQKRYTTVKSSEEAVLTSRDPYYLTLEASDRCYLYIFQLDSSGSLYRLFPDPKHVPTANPIPPGPLRVPDGVYWFYLDDVVGTERIFLIASRWTQRRLEELAARLSAEEDPESKRQLTEQILARIENEERATDDLPGLVFGIYQFIHK